MTTPRSENDERAPRLPLCMRPASPEALLAQPLDGHRRGEALGPRRAEVDAFVQRHFTWPGTLRLHRAALGADVLRAPVNVLLAPVLLLARLGAWMCRRLRLRRTADWLIRRRLLLRTDVAAQVEAAVLTELLEVPLARGDLSRNRDALSLAILSAPRFREAIRSRGSVDGAKTMADGIMCAVADYTGTRSAIGELTTALFTLVVGAIAFEALTPGMISMAPGVAEAVHRGTAISDFPLGSTLGSVWYRVFPAGPSPLLVTATVAGLVLLGSLVAAFAGTIADPVQARLGIHRRRLMRLLATLDAEIEGRDLQPFIAREHLLVRVFDLWDGALYVLRVFRG